VVDTSGLTTTTGQINAGSTTLLLSGAGPFSTTGGWTRNGVRYTGISGNTLTGIPATGAGSITTTIPYGTAIIAAPALTGVTGLLRALTRGATVNLAIQRDDLTAQAAAAARETTAVRVSDGIHEYLVSDERRNEASLTALCLSRALRQSAGHRRLRHARRQNQVRKVGRHHVVRALDCPDAHDSGSLHQ
jgi:hypothetical protein